MVTAYLKPHPECFEFDNLGNGGELTPLLELENSCKRGFIAAVEAAPLVFVWAKNLIMGTVSVGIYYMDVSSDIAVAVVFFESGNALWGTVAVIFLVLQYVVVWGRVKQYLKNQFGQRSFLHQLFTSPLFSPFLLIGLDLLMLLEIFGVLPLLPACLMPQWMREFIPSYKATRLVTEVVLESLLQCLLQSYVFVIVSHAIDQSTCIPLPENYALLVADLDLIPASIRISLLSFVKTFFELSAEAFASNISLYAKIEQLWKLGEGLPIDAIKKSTIKKFKMQTPFTEAAAEDESAGGEQDKKDKDKKDDEEEPEHKGQLLIKALTGNVSINTLDLSPGFYPNEPEVRPKCDAVHCQQRCRVHCRSSSLCTP